MKKIIRQIVSFLKNIFWTKPIDKDKATDVIQNYTCIKYRDQWINLRKNQVEAFHAMARSDKRGMAMRFKKQVEKGYLRFEEINGVMTCIKNKDYGNKESNR